MSHRVSTGSTNRTTSSTNRATGSTYVAPLLALALVGAACSVEAPDTTIERVATQDSAAAGPPAAGEVAPLDDPAYDASLSEPRQDPVYPSLGDGGLDALHYDLDLAWDPAGEVLSGREGVVLRATEDDDELVLDLSDALTVEQVRLDGTEMTWRHEAQDLVVDADVVADQRYRLDLTFSGTPRPVAAPTTRSDFSTNGWTITDTGAVWTMQEPSGAHSWYAVNDQPADKASYEITVEAPAPMRGVANGTLVEESESDGTTRMTWEMPQPTASYLVTVAIDDFVDVRTETAGGLPLSSWTPRSDRDLAVDLDLAEEGLAWLEERLGDYPFDTLGFLLVDSDSGMETQTMITLGARSASYTTSGPVLVHEMAHHWWGDLVTPETWRDLWMNEGMAMYLQAMWMASREPYSLDQLIAYWDADDGPLRTAAGPPADYDPETFGESNVYYVPAVMWHELRGRLGDDLFWRLVREWPQEHAYGNAGYDDIVAFFSEGAGEDLAPFFDGWLLGETRPS